MALVTGGELAAAVSRAGGLGIVGGGYAGTLGGEPDLEAEMARAKPARIGVGFITWALERAPTMLTKSLKHSPICVFLSFGDPRPFAAEIREAGALLICQVQLLSQIDVALEAGAAAVVAQGTEAGGHGASRSTFPFVPEAADYLKQRSPETLLLAAGGIADGRGLAAALMLGADGVLGGTRFWASVEALTPEAHTNKAMGVTGDSTIRTKVLGRRIKGNSVQNILVQAADKDSMDQVQNDITDVLREKHKIPSPDLDDFQPSIAAGAHGQAY